MPRPSSGLHLVLLAVLALFGGACGPTSRPPIAPLARAAPTDGWTHVEQEGWFHADLPGRIQEKNTAYTGDGGAVLYARQVTASDEVRSVFIAYTELPQGVDDVDDTLRDLLKSLREGGFVGEVKPFAAGPYRRADAPVRFTPHTTLNPSRFDMIGRMRIDLAPDRLVMALFVVSTDAPPEVREAGLARMVRSYDVE